MRIEVGYGLEGTLTDTVASRIIRNVMTPSFKAGDFDRGIAAGVEAIVAQLEGKPGVAAEEASPASGSSGLHINAPDLPWPERILLGAFIFGIIGLFTFVGVMTPGVGWFLYVFLIPFWAMFPIIIVGTRGALTLLGIYVVGYPLALVAFDVWRGVAGAPPAEGHGAEPLEHENWEAWAARGAAVCRQVYGRAYHKLLVNLRALHPALEDLVLVDAYGKVIGRPGLDLKRRELATVAAIAVLGAAQQLHSHLRGALNTGASAAEVEAVLGIVAEDLDPDRRRTTREQWDDVRKRKL